MKNEEELEWLKSLPTNWWTNHETVCLVADTFNRYGYFSSKANVISFFRKPWNYQKTINELINELKS